MKNKPLFSYFAILFLLCAGFVFGARVMGQQGMYLASGYMLTPALAALITRLFFYKPHFKDAGLRFGKFRDYIKYWLFSLAITALSYGMFTLFGAIRWDLSGKVFLDLIARQFALTGQDMLASLPPGFTPQMMLWLFFLGGLTVFNLMPGLITGFGEEFGHRGFMFPLLYPKKPWLGLLIGGFLWYLWHQPLLLILPTGTPISLWQTVVNHIGALIGSICTHTYLCYVYAKSRSIFVPSVAHITLDNAARSLSYFIILQNQFTANLALYLTMVLILAFLFYSKALNILLGTSALSKNEK
jgi:uncharacterized protein